MICTTGSQMLTKTRQTGSLKISHTHPYLFFQYANLSYFFGNMRTLQFYFPFYFLFLCFFDFCIIYFIIDSVAKISNNTRGFFQPEKSSYHSIKIHSFGLSSTCSQRNSKYKFYSKYSRKIRLNKTIMSSKWQHVYE